MSDKIKANLRLDDNKLPRMPALARLPNVASAPLPVSYERAKTALTKCDSLDECKTWADKAEALASYARQSGDTSLRKLADRIQARAIRRCGELLKQVLPSKGGRPSKTSIGTDTSFKSSRKQHARQAGLSTNQRIRAMRVERVPEATFEALVESDTPPTVTKLAEMGTMQRVSEISRRPGFSAATTAIGTIRRFAQFCQDHDAAFVAGGVTPTHVQALRRDVKTIDHWMDQFITRVGEEE